jgi:hypothetical protein
MAEEREQVRRFGAGYRRYKRRVRRYLHKEMPHRWPGGTGVPTGGHEAERGGAESKRETRVTRAMPTQPIQVRFSYRLADVA